MRRPDAPTKMIAASIFPEKSVGPRFTAALAVFAAAVILLGACASTGTSRLKGIETSSPGEFCRLSNGVLYLPGDWTPESSWPVTVVLHGYGELSLGLSSKYFWKDWAECYGIVLYFPETGHMGWHENPNSDDTKLLVGILRDFRKTAWVKQGGIQLFGWSAGAIMALDLVALNRKTGIRDGLFDRVAIASGGFGVPMDERLRRDPKLNGVARTPIFFVWGDSEPADHGKTASETLGALGWAVETRTHPGGHYIDAALTGEALCRNKR